MTNTREQFRAEHLPSQQALRVTFELEAGAPPRRIHILPKGPMVATRDGRIFQITSPDRVIATSETPMLVDWEHNSERAFGGTTGTRAAGWIEKLELADDGVWGTVKWTDEGEAHVRTRAYRFLSPVLLLDAESRDVQHIISVALTNTPALKMTEIEAYTFRGAKATPQNTGLDGAELERLKKNGMTDAQLVEAAQYIDQQRARRMGRS